MSKRFQVPDYYFRLFDEGNIVLVGYALTGDNVAIIIKAMHNSAIIGKDEAIGTILEMRIPPKTTEIELTIQFGIDESSHWDFNTLWFQGIQFEWYVYKNDRQ
jgi:hypothetical protein